VYRSYGARLFTAQRLPRISEYAEEKRTEFICMQRRDQSNSRFHGRDIFREIGLLP